MFNFKGCFKNRTFGFYLSFGSACVALIVAIVYAIAASGDRTFSVAGFALVLVGAVTEVIVLFTDFKFGPIIPTVFIAAGTSVTLVTCLPTLMDVLNGINFFGGNLGVAYAVPITLGVTVIAGCVASFMGMRKQPKQTQTAVNAA